MYDIIILLLVRLSPTCNIHYGRTGVKRNPIRDRALYYIIIILQAKGVGAHLRAEGGRQRFAIVHLGLSIFICYWRYRDWYSTLRAF